ncbi:MAG: hypothetical protein H7290_08705, partial [Flavobacterium sp.]|nr:hypothetical protein [Aeromicrobium sp.]
MAVPHVGSGAGFAGGGSGTVVVDGVVGTGLGVVFSGVGLVFSGVGLGAGGGGGGGWNVT